MGNWTAARLGDFIRIKHGYAFKGEFFASTGERVLLTPGNFRAEGGFEHDPADAKYYAGDFPGEFLLEKGTLLVAMTDLKQDAPILGAAAFVPEADRFLHNQRLGKVVVSSPEAVDLSFLYYLFNSATVRAQIRASATGSTVRHTAPERICMIEAAWPPVQVQRKIASILSAYDDLMENNLRRIKILEEMAQSLYKEWFVDFRFPGHGDTEMVDSPLGLIPQGWALVGFTDLTDVLSGGTPKTSIPEYWDSAIPFFTPRDASSSPYVLTTEKSISRLGLQKCASGLFPKDTVFITARGTVGKVALPAVDMAMNQSCYALRAKRGIGQLYLFHQTRTAADQLKKATGGATFDTIVIDTLERLRIVEPPLILVRRFEESVRPLFDLLLTLLRQNEVLRQTRDLLLPKLISGEIDVSDLDIDVGEDAA